MTQKLLLGPYFWLGWVGDRELIILSEEKSDREQVECQSEED